MRETECPCCGVPLLILDVGPPDETAEALAREEDVERDRSGAVIGMMLSAFSGSIVTLAVLALVGLGC